MIKNIVIAAVLLLGVAGVGYVVLGSSSHESSTQETSLNLDNKFVDLSVYQTDPSVYAEKRVVYFFHATWCPTCRTLEKDIKANIGSIPQDVVVVKTDFDSEQQLREQYGVTVQHTLVQVKADGSLIGKWVAQPSLSSVLSDLQPA